jgi:hypothetical protein
MIGQGLPLACGFGRGADGVFDAASEAVEAIGGAARAVLVFPQAGTDPGAALAQAAGAAQGAHVAGMSSDGVISSEAVLTGACAAVAFDDGFDVGLGIGEGAGADARAAGRVAVEQALGAVDVEAGHPVVLLLVDTTAAELGDVVAGAYEIAGARVPLAGGGANAPVGADAPCPWVFAGEDASTDAVVAVALVAARPVAVAHAHGGRPFETPAIVTRAEGRRLLRLNGAPAEEVYLEALGCGRLRLSDSAFERLAVLHPLAQLELDGKLRLLHVQGRCPEGGLYCSATIPENAAIVLTEETPAGVLASARDAAGDAEAALGRSPRMALVFDCAARRRIVASTIGCAATVAALAAGFGGSPAVAGVYTRGEVGRSRGPFGDLTHEIVVVAFA